MMNIRITSLLCCSRSLSSSSFCFCWILEFREHKHKAFGTKQWKCRPFFFFNKKSCCSFSVRFTSPVRSAELCLWLSSLSPWPASRPSPSSPSPGFVCPARLVWPPPVGGPLHPSGKKHGCLTISLYTLLLKRFPLELPCRNLLWIDRKLLYCEPKSHHGATDIWPLWHHKGLTSSTNLVKGGGLYSRELETHTGGSHCMCCNVQDLEVKLQRHAKYWEQTGSETCAWPQKSSLLVCWISSTALTLRYTEPCPMREGMLTRRNKKTHVSQHSLLSIAGTAQSSPDGHFLVKVYSLSPLRWCCCGCREKCIINQSDL